MHTPVRPAISRQLFVLLGSLSVLLAGCDATTSSPVPSPSLVFLSFSPIPTATLRGSAQASPMGTIASGWPPGWDVSFCTMLDSAITAQQLIVDVERAISDGATKDAKGLARDLADSAGQTTQLIAALPGWDPAGEALAQISGLMDYDTQAAAKYTAYFKDGTKAALRQARLLRRKDGAAVPQTNTALALLADKGVACPKHALQLESP